MHQYLFIQEALWELIVLPKNTTVSPARAWTQTAWSGNKHTNHEAVAPPPFLIYNNIINIMLSNAYQKFTDDLQDLFWL